MTTARDLTAVRWAEQAARDAHGETRNQHNGEPYITHVERVVEHLRKSGADEVILSVAWLHDVVEDTHVTLSWIRNVFGHQIADAVDAISHRPHEERLIYYNRVGQNRIALAVKLADLRDNTDPARKAGLDEKTRDRLDRKYKIAHWALIPWIIHHLKEF